MEQSNDPNRGPRSFEELLGAAVALAGAGFLVVSVILSSTAISGCGPCWPGPCADATSTPTPMPTGATPTPTPTPSPTPEAECMLGRDAASIDVNLWQVDSASCPRLLLSATGETYDHEELCESGLSADGFTNAFTFRYTCNASEAASTLVVAQPGTGVIDSQDVSLVVLHKVCPDVVPLTENFVRGQDLEPILWARNGDDEKAVASDWTEGCESDTVTEERLTACREVCGRTLSLRQALADFEIETTDGVDCYLALYDTFPSHVGTMVASAGNELAVNSLCGCFPNADFLDCLVGLKASEPCLVGATYDPICGQECWEEYPTDDPTCVTE